MVADAASRFCPLGHRLRNCGVLHRDVMVGVDTHLTARFFHWRFAKGSFSLGCSKPPDIFGAAVVVGFILFVIRRKVVCPRQIDYTRPDLTTEDLVRRRTSYRRGDVRVAIERSAHDAYKPVGWGLFYLSAGLDPATADIIRWSSHGARARANLAFGISGAVQHFAGMCDTETIAAVNTDPSASILGVAHYGAISEFF